MLYTLVSKRKQIIREDANSQALLGPAEPTGAPTLRASQAPSRVDFPAGAEQGRPVTADQSRPSTLHALGATVHHREARPWPRGSWRSRSPADLPQEQGLPELGFLSLDTRPLCAQQHLGVRRCPQHPGLPHLGASTSCHIHDAGTGSWLTRRRGNPITDQHLCNYISI